MELLIREVDFKAGAKFKGSNGGVAVGLPHRNSSFFNKLISINEKKKWWRLEGRPTQRSGWALGH
jgi:hypothetical protein